MSAPMRWLRTPFAVRRQRSRRMVGILLATLALLLGASTWGAHALRQSDIRSADAGARGQLDGAIQVVEQMPDIEKVTTASQMAEQLAGEMTVAAPIGVAVVDRSGVAHLSGAVWRGTARLQGAPHLTVEERQRLRRPDAMVRGCEVQGHRLVPWAMVTPPSSSASMHPWLLVGRSVPMPRLLTFNRVAIWIVAVVLVLATAVRSAHWSGMPRWRDAVRDLQWRTAFLVVGTTAITCALLSMLTLAQARNQATNATNVQLQDSGNLVLTMLVQQLHGHPQAASISDIPGLEATASGIAAQVAVAPVRSAAIDFGRMVQLSGDDMFHFQTLPSSCLDLSTFGELPRDGDPRGATWGGSGSCQGHPFWWSLVSDDDSGHATPWLLLVAPPDAQYGTGDLGAALVMGSAVAIMLAMTAASRLARSVQRPVVAVRQTAERIADGDLDARVAGRTNGELALLGGAVNQMADRLTSQIEQLEQANEHQRRFVSDVAHELRTPASALLASATALENPDTRDDAATRVVPQARRLAALTDDLLEISRLDAGQAPVAATEFDLCDLVREVARTGSRPGDVQVLAPPALPVCLDAVRVQVVVRNLVENALRHGRPPVVASVRCQPTGITVEVTDEGSGVPEDMREQVFERFVQADPSRHGEGSGLGLAIARANARLLGGDLTLDADGRTFRLRLPAPTQA